AELGGDIEVRHGAVLAGNLIVHGKLSGQGMLRPGHSVGTMSFGKVGNFSGDYDAEVNAAGAADLLQIETGTFDLSDINLYVSGENDTGGARLDHSYTVVRAPGGLSGEFENGGQLKGQIAHSLLQLEPIIYASDEASIRLTIHIYNVSVLTAHQHAQRDHMGNRPA